ncbi:MAG: hypothetical protein AABY95_01540 [Pseudomonadota bacterium]
MQFKQRVRVLLAFISAVACNAPAFAAPVWVYTCNGTRGEANVPLSSNVYATCTPAESGQWEQINIPQEFPTMDIVSAIIFLALVLCLSLGYIAGQQR